MNVNIETFFAVLGTTLGGVALVYTFLLNFKEDINSHIDRLEKRIDGIEARQSSQDDRMFLMSTGKTLAQAILDEKLKKDKKR